MMDTTSARTIQRQALRVLAVAGPGAVAIMVAWAGWKDSLGDRPTLVLMVYLLLLLSAAVAAAVAAMASLQLATARAFRHGYATARLHMVDVLADEDRSLAHVVALRSVE